MSTTANKLGRMTKRRPLTAKEKLVQSRLREIWQTRKKSLDLTQEKAAHLFGWASQGAVGAYLLGRTPVNTDALLKFAKLLEVNPTDIDPDFQWGDLVGSETMPAQWVKGIIEGGREGPAEPPLISGSTTAPQQIPNHVRELLDSILKRARDGSLTKEHTTVLKSSLELMTGVKK